ncbi:hypothetical protein ACFQJD_11705 [Haloplanus sp. GCM10025708]|uniref:hypothetical protein n=1 Tax=Haloplanus sp. GCM10025708 TaxID=3252679 RepID=UPI00361D9206
MTLLRVGDADGRRVHTGDVVRVSAGEFDSFDPAGNPDGNRPLRAAIASVPETAYWSFRAFGRELRSHPRPTVVAGALVAVGFVGESRLPVPDVVLGGAILVGCLALAYVGGGRL